MRFYNNEGGYNEGGSLNLIISSNRLAASTLRLAKRLSSGGMGVNSPLASEKCSVFSFQPDTLSDEGPPLSDLKVLY